MPTKKCWCYSGDVNFGDLLSPYILKHFGLCVDKTQTEDADIAGIGSILHMVGKKFRGNVWTSGLISEKNNFNSEDPDIKIYALRGKLTEKKLKNMRKNYAKNFALGDGGLLICDLFPKIVDKKYKLGLVPHYIDLKELSTHYKELCENADVVVIDLTQKNPMRVAEQIYSCDCILSSSLHGLIAADSFGIPNRQFNIPSSKGIVGGMFKFKDYYSCFPMEAPEVFHLSTSTTLSQAIDQAKSSGRRPNMKIIKNRLRICTQDMIEDFKKKIE